MNYSALFSLMTMNASGILPDYYNDLVEKTEHAAIANAYRHAKISASAAEHGMLRFSQGYSIEMIVDECVSFR